MGGTLRFTAPPALTWCLPANRHPRHESRIHAGGIAGGHCTGPVRHCGHAHRLDACAAQLARAQLENRLHERAQYVFATLEPELQMAGFLGLGASVPAPIPADLPASARSCGDNLIGLALAVEASDNRYSLACPAQGSGALAGADVLTLRRASAQLSPPAPGRAQLLGTLSPPSVRTLIWDGALPAGTTLQPSRTELRDLIVRSYYVARSSDGDRATPALRVKSLTAISGNPAFVDTEVMAGVDDLQVLVS